MKQLSKIFYAFLIIFGSFFISDYLFGLGATKYFFPDKSKAGYILSKPDDSDIVFFGSSRAYHHYDTPFITDSLGIKAFNAGEDGRGLTFQLPLIKTYLENNKPKLLVLEVFDQLDGFWNDRIAMLYPLVDDYPEIKTAAIEVNPYNKFFLNSNLYRYNSNVINELKNKSHPFTADNSRGFSPTTPNPPGVPVILIEEPQIKKPIDPVEENALKNILEFCIEKDIKVIGVNSPIYQTKKSLGVSDSIFRSYNFPFIDNTTFRLPLAPEEYFKDNAHLTEKGAREYTKYFMKQITDSLKLL